MTNSELLDRVRELRERGRTPKEIARVLGMPPSAVAPLVKAVATALPRKEPALAGCWITCDWAAGLSVAGHPDWPDASSSVESGGSGLVNVVVARDKGGSTVSACSYLVDVWCLGVKDAIGPKSVDRRKLPEFVGMVMHGPFVAAPLELAQHLVLGAVDYARGLGFSPHPDFAQGAGHLGSLSGRSDITFGRDGTPFYIGGPHDDTRSIMRTLQRSGR
jgi:hypothetical protein